MTDTKRKHKATGKKRRNKENGGAEELNQSTGGKEKNTNEEKRKGVVLGNKKRKSEKLAEADISGIDEFGTEPESDRDEKDRSGKKDRKKSRLKKQKRNDEKIKGPGHDIVQLSNEDEGNDTNYKKKKSNVLRNKKRKSEKVAEADISETDEFGTEPESDHDEKNRSGKKDRKKSKWKKKNRNDEKIKGAGHDIGQLSNEDKGNDTNYKKKKSNALRNKKRKSEKVAEAIISGTDEFSSGPKNDCDGRNSSRKKDKKKSELKKKKRNKEKIKEPGVHEIVQLSNDAHLSQREVEEDEVYQISSGDEDCSKGMKKWLTEHHLARPGPKILQQKIDDFIVAHEAEEERARKEREAQAAEGGWTVVSHQKGRKKTKDSESGVTVGSIAQAAVMDKMSKKKNKEVLLDVYGFQKREAKRNEIMMLQSKFELDKKRIQQMRAARKFQPY